MTIPQTTSSLPASLWAATAAPAASLTPLSGDLISDVVVIGAGYTGLSCALHLARKGFKVALLEAFEPGWGASGRNGGQIIAGLKHNPDKLEALFGSKLGGAITKEYGAGAALVFSLIDRYSIECDDRRSGWIQAAHGPRPMQDLVSPRFTQWKARGVDARLLDGTQVAELVGSRAESYCGGWLDPRGGVLQPLSYARGLARAALSEGVSIYSQSPAESLRRDNGIWEVRSAGGSMRARDVVLATNAYTGDLWEGLRRSVIPVTSFQIATAPLAPSVRDTILPGGQGVTDTRRLLLYFRLDRDGRLVMGGRSPVEDEPTFGDAAPLREALARIFPQAAGTPLEYVWSGKVAITKDGMPHVHRLAPGLHAALGFNGRGVAASTVTGKILADLVAAPDSRDLPFPVTVPDRYAFHGLRKVGIFALSHYYRLLDRLETTG